jgi:hypothetical protein
MLVRALLLAVLASPGAGCTYLDKWLPGTPFTPDQPIAEVTLDGEMHVDPASGFNEGCPSGGTVFWGTARNTGDIPVVDVSIFVNAYGPGNAFLGSFRTSVFSGEIIVEEGAPETAPESAATDLDIDESGTFEVCAPLPFGSVVRTEYRTEFIVIDVEENL